MTLPVQTSPEEFHRLELSIAALFLFCAEIQNWFVYPYSIGVPINGPMTQLREWQALDESERKKQVSVAESLYGKLISVLVHCDSDEKRFQRSLLGLAVEKGYSPLMVDLLKAGANLHVKPRRGESPLYYAASKDRLEMVRMIIQEYKAREREKSNIIDAAVNIGVRVKALAALLESKGVMLHRNPEPPLYNPSAEVLIGNVNQLIEMIEHPRILRVLMEEGLIHYASWLMEAVFYAIRKNRKDLLDIFIEKEIDFNFCDEEGDSPLSLAAKLGFTELIKPLTEAGAEINFKNKEGHTPIIEAGIHKHSETVELLKQLDAKYDLNDPNGMDILSSLKDFTLEKLPDDALLNAAKSKRENVFFKLIASKHPVNHQDQDGFTALMFASGLGQVAMVDALIKAKADLNHASQCKKYKSTGLIWGGGSTALMWAAEKNQKEVVKLLILGGADLTLKNQSGQTALDCAREAGHLELLPILRIGLIRQFYRKLVASSPEAVPELIQEQKRAGLTQEDLYQFMLKTETEPDKRKILLNQALDKNTSLGLYLSTSQGLSFKTFFSTPLKPTQARIQQELFKLEPKKPAKGLTYN